MPSILFVCTGNIHRSPLAAAFLTELLHKRGLLLDWRVESAGTWTLPQQHLPEDVIHEANLLGLDLEGHTTRIVTNDLLAAYDLILVMERGQKEALRIEFPESEPRVHLLTEMLEGVPPDIPDPLLQPGEHTRLLREMLDVIERAFPRIKEMAESHVGSQR